jgi:hypothetical protein
MNKLQLISVDFDINNTRSFLNDILECHYGIADSLEKRLSDLNKEIEELSFEEIEKIFSDMVWTDGKFYNLINEEGEYILPWIYTVLFCRNQTLYGLAQLGVQSINLITKSGRIIYQSAYDMGLVKNNHIYITDEKFRSELYKYDEINEKLKFVLQLEPGFFGNFEFSEAKWFYENGFFSEDFKPVSPLMFDNGRQFSEGLAAVCLNGKWGYIDHKSEIVVDFQYGDAEDFTNGEAWVFKLNEEFKDKIGEWTEHNGHDLDSRFQTYNNEFRAFYPNSQFDNDEFTALYPNFPKQVYKPLYVLRNNYKSTDEVIEEYHDFSKGIADCGYTESEVSNMGEWVLINTKGEIMPKGERSKLQTISSREFSRRQEKALKTLNTSQEFWLDQIKENYLNVKQIPDSLFLDKNFVIEAIKVNTFSFQYFAPKYKSDEEVCDIAFELNYHNFKYFSNVQKQRFQERYDKLYEDDELPF